ncbi:hypothetical protein [Mucilaginibacter celer]|uniref:Uncharacterized protein n=1 Tax=Mucilaginibacter celer TaxID=2305508 RepID=A0A494W0R6_9SPHI|nr:hypothetical protein [Mucilaginibacter celer]AYL97313.1 hypothetical protein HYN43_019245 [Mucilaginibacter celer]
MQYSTFLKKQATAFVDIYQKQFLKTIGPAFLWTVLCFIIIEVLSNYSNYDTIAKTHPVSILSFFTLRFSSNEVYCLADNGKSVFLFFVSIFSVKLLHKVNIKSVVGLLLILIVCVLLDFSFFRLKGQLHHAVNNQNLDRWIANVIFHARIYIPLILFALVIQLNVFAQPIKPRQLVFLLIAVYFFNEAAYEVTLLLRGVIFELLMIPVKAKSTFYFVESALGSVLMASCFLGFHCAMTAPFSLTDVGEEKG